MEHYKSEDIAKIKAYLSAQPAEVSVADIVVQAGAEKLRVYPILCQMEQDLFLPDKTHIHHKLLKAGMSQRTTMVSLVVTSVVSSLFFITLSVWIDVNVIIVAGVVLFTWGNRRLNTIINAKGI